MRAPVIKLGLNPDRSLEVPTDFGDTGWWTGGPRPGERGPAVIVGHVDSHTGPAVFYRLASCAGATRSSSSAATAAACASPSRAASGTRRMTSRPRASTVDTHGPTLRLITCWGDFDRSTGHYVDNTVVYAH